MSEPVPDATWTRRVYERHLDLILAEELACNRTFLLWFLDEVRVPRAPDGSEPVDVTVTVTDFDEIGEGDGSAGENDLLVDATFSGGYRVRVLVEDKLDAVVQPDQGERYRRRIAHHAAQVNAAAGAAVAPSGYLRRHGAELDPLVPVSIEQIVTELEHERAVVAGHGDNELAARLGWRAQHLIQLRTARRSVTPDHLPTIQARTRIAAQLLELAPTAAPRLNSMRTANTGWLYFDSPDAVVYKVVHGWVDVYLRDLPFGDELAAATEGGPSGFELTADTVGNRLYRGVVRPDDRSTRIRPITQVSDDELDLGAQRCAAAVAWVHEQTTAHALRPG